MLKELEYLFQYSDTPSLQCSTFKALETFRQPVIPQILMKTIIYYTAGKTRSAGPFGDTFSSGACRCMISCTMEAIFTFSRMSP